MANIKIKQLDERVATAGVHLGGGPTRRKLQPGEVVDIPEDLQESGVALLEALLNTKKVEITLDPITRPLDYESEQEAKLTAPNYRSRGQLDDANMERARIAVAERIAKELAGTTPKSTAAKVAQPTANRRRNHRAASEDVPDVPEISA